jgi:hypothetical protein
LPSFFAFTQHLCSHSLPAAFALSQQDSALARLMLPSIAIAHNRLVIDFILVSFDWPAYRFRAWLHKTRTPLKRLSLNAAEFIPPDYSEKSSGLTIDYFQFGQEAQSDA